jgi:hypothetical protein
MGTPTTEDAKLILKLVRIGQSDVQREAFRFVTTEFSAKDYAEFAEKYPHGSKESQQVGTVLGFFETAGVLVSHGLLNEDIFFDLSFGLDPVWEKLGPILPGWQKATMPALWENAIWLHRRYVAWRKNVWTPNLKWKSKAARRKK